MKKAESFDQFSQIKEDFYFDESTGMASTIRSQDVEPILDFNRMARNHVNTNKKGEMHHVARIPLIMIEQWKANGVIDWFNSTDAQRRKVLNDPANAMFRTRECKL